MRLVGLMLSGVLVVAGCGHMAARGSVVMKISETQAHVCMGDKEVAAGDRVQLVRNDCTAAGGKVPLSERCKRVVVGQGQVTQVINEHYSVVDFPIGVPFKEGDSIEKVK
jgi:hypothetical protein